MHFRIDEGLKNYWIRETGLPAADVFISSTSWAFRNRLRLTKLQQLTFPFMCFRIKPGGIHRPDSTWVQNFYNTHGRWLDEMNNPNANTGEAGDRVKIYPFYADYEAIFWSNEYVKTAEMFQRVYKTNWDENVFEYKYTINGEDYLWDGLLEFSNLELDPEFQEQEELSKSKLHSVSLDFQAKAFIFEGMAVEKADGAVLEMIYSGNLEDTENTQSFDYDSITQKLVPL